MATPNIYGELPPELLGDQRAIDRKQKIAEAMMAQGMSPLGAGRMVGNIFVPPHWAEGLGKLAQAYVGNKGVREADAGYKDIGKRYSQMYQDEIANVMNLRSGSAPRPQQMSPDDMAMIADQGGESAPTVQDVKPNAIGSMNAALSSQIPAIRKIGEVLLQQQLKGTEPFTLPAGAVRYGPDGQPIASAPFRPTTDKTFKVGDTRHMRSGRSIITQEYQPDGTWKELARGEVDKPASATVHNPAPVTMVTFKDDTSRTGWSARDARGGTTVIKDVPPPPTSAEAGNIKNETKNRAATAADQRGALRALSAAGYDPETGKDGIEDLIMQSTSGWVQKMGAEGLAAVNIATSGRKALNTLNAAANKITLELMDRKLGAGISNADRDFIVGQLGDVGNANKTAEERLAAWRFAKSRMIDVGMLPAAGGAPKATPAGIPQGSTIIGKTPDGKDVYQSPDGKKWVP